MLIFGSFLTSFIYIEAVNQPNKRNKYIYGPVKSWRMGTSLGIDPIGDISSCSFNCTYCQLGRIQNITDGIKQYVPTSHIIEDLKKAYDKEEFTFTDLDVITFAGSGEPTLADNLAEIIFAVRALMADRLIASPVPISILTNATMFDNVFVLDRASNADIISLKLDAPNDELLKKINQPHENISIEKITAGIKALKEYCGKLKKAPKLQLQMMFMPKFLDEAGYLEMMAEKIIELEIPRIQINTPSRPRPVYSTDDYWIETRGNHYSEADYQAITPDFVEYKELPAISKEKAFELEDKLIEIIKPKLPELEIVNVYKR